MTATGTRLTRLRTLIAHPATGEHERATAQRMLDRLLSRTESAAGRRSDRGYGTRHGRAGRHADLERIAEMIGDDIVFARHFSLPATPGEVAEPDPIRDAPPEITFSVTTGPGRITVTIECVPTDPGWFDESAAEPIGPRLATLAEHLAALVNDYNHEGSDIGTRFFTTVRMPDRTLIW